MMKPIAETTNDPSDTFVNIHLHSREYYDNNPDKFAQAHNQQNVEKADEESAANNGQLENQNGNPTSTTITTSTSEGVENLIKSKL